MARVRAVLETLRLAQYAASFEELGFDDLDYLLEHARLAEVASAVGMKPGHASKFERMLQVAAAGTP